MVVFPQKLKQGDEVRIISPSRSMSIISDETRIIADKRFLDLGLKLSYSKHIDEVDQFYSSPIDHRIADLEEAFSDPKVKAILTSIGGFNSNQLLSQIDWQIIKNNPKIFCGFSDITLLSNAIFAKTNMVTYSGPHYSSFGMEKYFDYTLDYFKKCLISEKPYEVIPSDAWSDDEWFLDQEKREVINNKGWLVVHEGQSEGRIVGGNLSTLNLLRDGEYMPDIKDTILFLEDDAESLDHHFDRNLVSLFLHPDFDSVRGIVFGRFQKASKISNEQFIDIIETKKELKNLPIIANVDFGHTSPMITFPIGGMATITASTISSIKIIKH